MTNLDIKGIREKWKAFKYWHDVNPSIQVSTYSETAGPDVELLLDAVEKMAEALRLIVSIGCGVCACSDDAKELLKELGLAGNKPIK